MIIFDILLNIIYYVLHIYVFCIIIAGVLSFVGANPYNQIVTFFRIITTPPCKMLVKKYPKLLIRTENGFIDLSPVILLLIIGCLMIIVQKVGFYMGIYI